MVHEFFRRSYTRVYNKDAIHVATAIYLKADVLETFDQDLIPNSRTRTGSTKKVASCFPKTKTQSDKSFEKARELECNEDKPVFEDKLRRIARQKPKKEKTQDHSTRLF